MPTSDVGARKTELLEKFHAQHPEMDFDFDQSPEMWSVREGMVKLRATTKPEQQRPTTVIRLAEEPHRL